MLPPWPFGVWQRVDVVVSHVVVRHNVLPTRTVGVRFSGAKLLPDRVMDDPDEVGPLISFAKVTTGESYEKAWLLVLTTSMVTIWSSPVVEPGARLHATDESVVHTVVRQSVLPI